MSAVPHSRGSSAYLSAAEIHSALASRWADVLTNLGVDPAHLRNRHGPCPICGGKDRFRYDDRHQRGDWVCTECGRVGSAKCGGGDGFKLLQLLHGWTFAEARRAVMEAAGLRDPRGDDAARPRPAPRPAPRTEPEIAQPTARVKTVLRTSTTPDAVPDVIEYLRSRALWPLPAGCTWRAHVGIDYYRDIPGTNARECVGRYPALIASVRDVERDLVTAHVTWLHDVAKAPVEKSRKFLSPMTGRIGCAARLSPLNGDALGIAEGIETAIAASVLHDNVPVWSALNTSLLAKFMPPPEVRRVIVFADRDVAGMDAAWTLRDTLEGRCAVELRLPPATAKDWADVLKVRA